MQVTPDNPLHALSSRFEVVDGYWIPRNMVESISSSTVRCTNNVIIARSSQTPATISEPQARA
jgi:hypothetical protein